MLLLSVALPVVTGYFVINALWPDQKFFSSFAIKTSLAIGLGFGISSCIFFISIVSLNVINDFFIPLELFVLFVLIALSLTSIFKRNGCTGYTVDHEHFSRHSQMLLIRGFWIALALSILFFIIRSFNNPHGDWDAWAIWNMRARFLYRSGSNWLNAFSNIYGWSHPDYPLLLSSNVARIWHYCKGETTIAPIFIAFLFTYSTLMLIVSSVTYLCSYRHGLLAGLVLLGIACFTRQGISQMADVPFGFFILAAIVVISLYYSFPEKNRSCLFLAGLMSGFSAWTKNEGFLFVGSLLLSHFIVIVTKKGWKYYLSDAKALFAGIFPILALVLYFKILIAPPNDLFSGQKIDLLITNLFDYSRYLRIGKWFLAESFSILLRSGSIIVLISCIFFLRFLLSEKHKIGFFISILILLIMLSGYFMVYVITPHDLIWHLDTSLNRLFIQLLPMTLFIFFVALRPIETLSKKN